MSGNAFVWTLQANGKSHDAAVWGGSDPFESAERVDCDCVRRRDRCGRRGGGATFCLRSWIEERQGRERVCRDDSGNGHGAAGTIGMPAAAVNTPAASETFAGVSDAFLLRLQP